MLAKVFAGILALSFFACAEPRYESVVLAPAADVQTDETETPCLARFRVSGHCLQWSWETLPSASEPGVLRFKVLRANRLDGSALPLDLEGTASVVLWMPSMGHGSTPTQTKQVDIGSFRATQVYFVMPGEWEIRFQFRQAEKVLDEAVVPFLL